MNRILIKVFWGDNRPFISGSKIDSALLQSASYAHERIQQGFSDIFLFLFCGVDSESEAGKVVARYGFPNQTIICIPADYEGQMEDFNDHTFFEEFIECEIESWLRKNHPGAIPYLMTDNYEPINAWWSGIEAGEDCSWDKKFARSLPDTHYHRADTWMEILCETAKCDWESWREEQELGLQMASLCEWLHGFEQVSENFSNHFEAIPENFGLDNEYLIYAAMKINGEVALSIDEAENKKDLSSQALKLLVCDKRDGIVTNLKEYFGGETGLYSTLWFCVRPDYKRPMMDLMVNIEHWDGGDMHTLSNTWMFVHDGWSDLAEQP